MRGLSLDADDLENSQVLQLQQRIIEDQDEDLDRLGAAIGRQREIGLMIGEELEYHVSLLEETDVHIDSVDGKLNNAKKSLSKISKKVKDKTPSLSFENHTQENNGSSYKMLIPSIFKIYNEEIKKHIK
ncbi:4803_t:CDS:2 [Entrophospora sp. SA101]|nr:4803_t:CDS:2 [Entrophospora sp. SA101]